MSVPLMRTLLLRSILKGSLRNVSRPFGTVKGTLVVPTPSHSVLARSRNLSTTFAATAAAATTKKPTAKKPTTKKPTTKGRTVVKKKLGTKKKASPKKKVASKKKVVAKKKKPAKKAVKPKAPRIFKKSWTPPFKKPLSSWTNFAIQFMNARRGDQPVVFADQLRAASVEWKKLSEEQKADYGPTTSEMEEYSHKLAEWNAKLSKPLRLAKRNYGRVRRKPHNRPLTVMAQFIKEEFRDFSYPAGVNTSILKVQHLAHIYKYELSDADKAGLRERANKQFEQRTAGI